MGDFLKPLNKTLSDREGGTKDIVNVLLNVVKTRPIAKQTAKFAKQFTADKDGLDLLWYYTRHNIRYEEDPIGQQWIKEPARLIADGVGDCKSMTLFNVSVMMNVGIKWKIRFASYSSDRVFTHVYPVAVLNGKEVIVDSVWDTFDSEKRYTYKKDYDMTRIMHLAGVGSIGTAISDIEAIANQLPNSLLNDDITTMSQGEFMRFLAAENLKARAAHATGQVAADLKRAVTAVEQGVRIAGIGALTQFLNQAHSSTDKAFTPPVLALPEVGYYEKVGKLDIRKITNKAGTAVKTASAQAKQILTAPAKAVVKVVQTAWQKIMNWIFKEALPKTGAYFLLLFAKPVTAKLQAKAAQQRAVLAWIAKVTGQSEAALLSMIETGIIKQTGKTPAQIIAASGKKVAGIGVVLTLAAVSAAVTVVTDIIAKIIALFKKKDAPSVKEGTATAEEIANETVSQTPVAPSQQPQAASSEPAPSARAQPIPPTPQAQAATEEVLTKDTLPTAQSPILTQNTEGGTQATSTQPQAESSGGGSSMMLIAAAVAALIIFK